MNLPSVQIIYFKENKWGQL